MWSTHHESPLACVVLVHIIHFVHEISGAECRKTTGFALDDILCVGSARSVLCQWVWCDRFSRLIPTEGGSTTSPRRRVDGQDDHTRSRHRPSFPSFPCSWVPFMLEYVGVEGGFRVERGWTVVIVQLSISQFGSAPVNSFHADQKLLTQHSSFLLDSTVPIRRSPWSC